MSHGDLRCTMGMCRTTAMPPGGGDMADLHRQHQDPVKLHFRPARTWKHRQNPYYKYTRSQEKHEFRLRRQPRANHAAIDPQGRLATPPNTNDTFNLGSLGDQPYHYRALEARQIRLLRVHPARKHQVQCELIHVSLDDLRPYYVAISYAWGEPGIKENICLFHEGFQCDFPVASSLYGALEALRHQSESVWVWVDGLCINQQDREEKSKQVQLMTSIYSSAKTVAIWLGPQADGSHNAVRCLQDMADKADSPGEISKLIRSSHESGGLAGVVSLFARNYWQRLWVVQEVLNSPKDPIVYCGSTKKPWKVYRTASNVFKAHRAEIDKVTQGKMDEWAMVPYQFSTSQILVYEGPNSLPGLKTNGSPGDESLLHVLRLYRRKLASDPRDKLYGILGILPESIRQDFRPNYDKSVKNVYSDIVATLIYTTGRVDVICDAIHFPLHTGAHGLPSFVPDWSHIPQTSALGHRLKFSASKGRRADAQFTDSQLSKLKFWGIYLDTVETQGVAVGTHCRSSDWLMAFLHWRALVLQYIAQETAQSAAREAADFALSVHEEFAETLCLGQIPPTWAGRPRQWLEVCYHVFATLLRGRLPHLALDDELSRYARKDVAAKVKSGGLGGSPREFLQAHFGDRMMGRCFVLTKRGRLGMGSGYMAPGDIIVVPLGCSTPVLLRADGPRDEYRFVGDIYLHRFMRGRAVDMLEEKKLKLTEYTIH
ncbi:heterokaryon incompatibility protein-domain-containing protein [Apiospora kogelbergensis]|uniref:Heterokaryon incompatibility protein-domain-containing protein n=1 Tax=Apiospora kogelbergensis TaxID=1337665 RepID=A0AAW0Q7Z7_9PEZI